MSKVSRSRPLQLNGKERPSKAPFATVQQILNADQSSPAMWPLAGHAHYKARSSAGALAVNA